jgi:putative transposase
MIDREHDPPITKQADVLRISRGSVYYLPRPVSEADLAIMRRLDRLHLELPFAGSRMLRGLLAAEGCRSGRRHVKTLMKRMGIEALYRRPRTTKPEPGHKIYPYLLRGMEVTRPNQVWAPPIATKRGNAANDAKCYKRPQRLQLALIFIKTSIVTSRYMERRIKKAQSHWEE